MYQKQQRMTVLPIVFGKEREYNEEKRKGITKMDHTGETALATGAASGMGLLFSQNWASLGGNVVMCDVNEAVLAEKVAEI